MSFHLDLMKTACLYIRVSTDEQAVKGFSQGHQEDVLRHYCLQHSIKILRTIFEDFSAKTFNRPKWSAFLSLVKKYKTERPDLLLFTKWDRFSRNASDAYWMIKVLQKLNIDPQAIEQPLDLSIPENKITLAFYLVAPEVENDRRSLNVKSGMRKARLEGRWMGSAPIGYTNKVSASGVKYIAPCEPAASLLKEAFEQIAAGHLNVRQAFKAANSRGLLCSFNNFCTVVRNPVYCGKVSVAGEANSPPVIVEGKHQAIISEVLFNEVQKVLEQRKKKTAAPITRSSVNELFPFRGFLFCPKCQQKLTGSVSKGRTKQYAYYHCNSRCHFRIRTDHVHKQFADEIAGFKPKPGYVELFANALKKIYRESHEFETVNQQQVIRRIEELRDHIISVRSLLLSKDLSVDEYHELKSDCLRKIAILENKQQSNLLSLGYFTNRIEQMTSAISSLRHPGIQLLRYL